MTYLEFHIWFHHNHHHRDKNHIWYSDHGYYNVSHLYTPQYMNPHNNQQHNHNYSDYNDIPIIVILITDSMIMTHITIITSRFTCSSEETLITLTSTIYTLSIHTRILVACTYTIRNNTLNYRFLDQKYHSHIGILTIMDHNLHFHYTPRPHRHQSSQDKSRHSPLHNTYKSD